MNDELQVVYVAGSAEQAHVIANALRDREIEAVVDGDSLHLGLGGLPFGMSTAPRVLAPEYAAGEARRIVLELTGEPATVPGKRPMQFRIRTLLFLTAAVAVFLALDRLLGWRLAPRLPQLPMVVLYLAAYGAVVVIAYRVIFRRRSHDDGEDDGGDESEGLEWQPGEGGDVSMDDESDQQVK